MKTKIVLIKDNLQYNLQYQLCLSRDFDERDFRFQVIMNNEFCLNSTQIYYKNLNLSVHNINQSMPKAFWAIRIWDSKMFYKGCLSKCDKGYVYQAHYNSEETVLMPLCDEEKEKKDEPKSRIDNETSFAEKENVVREEEYPFFEDAFNKYPELCSKIVDVDFFKLQMSFYNDELESECDIQHFIEKYIETENGLLYIKENIHLTKMLEYFPQISQFILPQEEIEEALKEKSNYLDCWSCKEVFDEDFNWLYSNIDFESVLQKILKEVFEELKEANEELTIERLKEKYTEEFVLSLYKDEVEQIENIPDMMKFLSKLLSSHTCKSEVELKRHIKDFFNRYKNHEKEYRDFLSRYPDGCYVIEYSTEKEAKYNARKYTQEENEEGFFFNEVMKTFWEYYGTPQGTRLRMNIPLTICSFKYLTDFIKELFRIEVLNEVNGEVGFYKLDNFKKIKKELLYYSTWANTEQGMGFNESFSGYVEAECEKQREKLKEKILANENFYVCSNRVSRLKFLRAMIVEELETGNDNYFYCLDAYTQSNLGVCFRGKVASNFIDKVWKERKKQ